MSKTLTWSRPKELALNRKLPIYLISEKEDNLLRYAQIFEHFSWKFPFHLIFIPEFSVEWFAFRKFQNYSIFWTFSREIPIPFDSVSKISEFLVEWKALLDNSNISITKRFFLSIRVIFSVINLSSSLHFWITICYVGNVLFQFYSFPEVLPFRES